MLFAPVRPFAAARRRQLVWCVLAVALVHGALLAAARAAEGQKLQPRTGALHVRLLSSDVQALIKPDTGTDAAERVAMLPKRTDVTDQAAARGVEPAPAAELQARESRDARSGGGDADVVYLPRAALTVAPRARSPVNIAYPYFDGEAETYIGEFELFVDDTGGVVQVVSTTPELPGLFVSAVRQAFLAAAFVPGEREGKAVRSRIRIEVTFDRRDLQPS